MKGKNRREYGKIIECLMSSDPEINLLGIELLKRKSIYQNLPKWYIYWKNDFKTGVYTGYYRLKEIQEKIPSVIYDHTFKAPLKSVVNSLMLHSVEHSKRIILSWLLLQLKIQYGIYWKL